MPDYAALRTRTASLIAKFGGDVQIRRRAASGYDPTTDSETVAEALYSVPGVIASVGKDDLSTPVDRLVHVRMAKVSVAAEGLAISPEPGDGVKLPGDPDWWTVNDVKTTRPDGTALKHAMIIGK